MQEARPEAARKIDHHGALRDPVVQDGQQIVDRPDRQHIREREVAVEPPDHAPEHDAVEKEIKDGEGKKCGEEADVVRSRRAPVNRANGIFRKIRMKIAAVGGAGESARRGDSSAPPSRSWLVPARKAGDANTCRLDAVPLVDSEKNPGERFRDSGFLERSSLDAAKTGRFDERDRLAPGLR